MPLERCVFDYLHAKVFGPKLFRSQDTLHLELRSVTCNGTEENQAHRCDPYDLRVQEQPLFLVCSSINIFTSMGLDP